MWQQNYIVGQAWRLSNLYHLLDFSRLRKVALIVPVRESRTPADVFEKKRWWGIVDSGTN